MRRIRLVFALVTVAVLVPLALLVRTALASAEAERELQHRVVAERIVDEMERELTALLTREEDRPFAHYRHEYVPDAGAGADGERVRSPLASPPAEPFVVGWFQVAPDGTVTSPLAPEVGPPAPAVAAVAGHWERDRRAARDLASQAPGTTVAVEEPAASPKGRDEAAPHSQAIYVERLNRATSGRSLRKEKVSPVQMANVYADRAAASEAEAASPAPAADDTVEARLEPMVGEALADDRMVLYRTVLVGDRAYRQGLVLDVPRLVAELERRVLAGDLAGGARVAPASADAATLPGYVFRHRFADPFGPVTATIALEPFPGLGGRAWVVTLSLVLAAVAALGLLAVYRMVSVVVAYAERRSNFVSAVTHELKTPLTAIRMYGEMLRDGVVADEAKRQRYFATITAEGERLSRLLDNVLELSRIERKHRVLELEAGDVAPAVEHAVAVLRPHAEKEGFALALEVEDALPAVVFERDALTQVVFNLVDNAIKYSRRAAAKDVVVRVHRHGDGVAVTVADRGPGVERRHLRRIFEPFYRGEDELTRTTKGTGIGLALVRGLVEKMGGRVAGRNREAGGFEVTVLLPATS